LHYWQKSKREKLYPRIIIFFGEDFSRNQNVDAIGIPYSGNKMLSILSRSEQGGPDKAL
jgi:hypothetical protein